MNHQTPNQSEVAKFVAEQLARQLDAGKKVLWLLSGGSGGQVCIDASKLLAGHDLTNLYVTFSDERYGEPGHADENYQILMDGGLDLPGATMHRPLQGLSEQETAAGLSEQETAAGLSDWLSQVSQQVDYKFAVMGVGADGHTAGAKPYSPAVGSAEPAVIYQADDFTRLTVTLSFIESLDEAVVQAYGDSKHEIAKKLLNREGDVASFPALAIHDIPTVTMFSDLSVV